MKCDKCKNKRYHPGGNLQDVAEGGDDPYAYWYCAAGHWEDDPENEPTPSVDPFENCQDYGEIG